LRARMVTVGRANGGNASGTCSGTGSPAQAPVLALTAPVGRAVGIGSDDRGLETVVREEAQENTDGGGTGPEVAAPNLAGSIPPQTGQEGIRVVKRRKKVRQAEMQ